MTGKNSRTVGKMSLVASFAACSSMCLLRRSRDLGGLDPQGVGQRRAVPLRLDEGLRHRLDLGDLRTIGKRPERLIPGHTSPHVADGVLELGGQRAPLVVATRRRAASKPMPASTQMVSWSMVSDTAPSMASWRLVRWLEIQNRERRSRPPAEERRAADPDQGEEEQDHDERRLDAQQPGHIEPMRMAGLSQVGLHVEETDRDEVPQLGAEVSQARLGACPRPADRP